jgi:hypothetical protein
MHARRLLIVVAVLAMLAVDALLLKKPELPQIVQPVIRPRREVKLAQPSFKVEFPGTNVLEALSPSSNPVQNLQTTNRTQVVSKPDKPISLATNTPSQTAQWDAFWSSFPLADPIQDPVAHIALAYVGMDRDAEDYWYEAINDSTVSEQERRSLIEGLSQEGFADPADLTLDDVPLILTRIRIVELLGPDAMDQANADAFTQAYMDLVSMYYSVVFGEEEQVGEENQPEEGANP